MDAAFNQTILDFDKINEHLLKEKFVYTDPKTEETSHYHNYGFDLKAVKFIHRAFDQFNHQNVIDATQLNSTLGSNALFREQHAYSLVAFFTGKEISDGYNGFKRGPVCEPPNNAIAVSFYKCPLIEGDNAENEQCLITIFHELLHAIGVPHSKDEDDDVMKEFKATNMV